jgi:hypothetical protein
MMAHGTLPDMTINVVNFGKHRDMLLITTPVERITVE